MAGGILIDSGDGYPLTITSGVRFLKFCGSVSATGSVGVGDSGLGTINQSVPNVVAGKPVYFIPTGDTFYFESAIYKTILKKIDAPSNNTIRQYAEKISGKINETSPFVTRAGFVLQRDTSNTSNGVLVSDSSDFVNITDTQTLTFCAWSGWITTSNGIYDIRSRFGECVVFAKWSDNGTFGVEYDGRNIYTYGNDLPYGDNRKVSARLHIVVFKRGAIPDPGNGGLAIWNKNGQCTFSSSSKPFVWAGDIVPANGGSVGDNYIALGQYGIAWYVFNSHDFYCTMGLVRNGNSLSLGGNRRIYTGQYYGERPPVYYKFEGVLPMIRDIFPK